MRLIEVQDVQRCAAPLSLRAGDVLLLHASGGRVRSGAGVVEVLGPLVQATVGTGGGVVTPAGPPNVVLVRAWQPGRATLEVMSGDPFAGAQRSALEVEVEA